MKGKKELRFLTTLCEKTVPMARIAPSQVDIEAAMIATRAHPPKNAGASCVSILMNALGSGSHNAQVGNARALEQVSVSNIARAVSGP
mmetsp:Transcript_20864/g.31332  ORF Transcript_20864/g.31332 Transcript_20864/m.31332 type:complete len:88 (+) Transcript_20864:786-1049(+)